MKSLFVMAFFLSLVPAAEAHQVGDMEWCLAYTAYHRECVFKKEVECSEIEKSTQKYFQKNKASFARILKENPKQNPNQNNSDQKASFSDFEIHCEPNLMARPNFG